MDRLWPRGVTKNALHIEAWLKDLAPSDELRRWQRLLNRVTELDEDPFSDPVELQDVVDAAKRMNTVEAARKVAHFEKGHWLLPFISKFRAGVVERSIDFRRQGNPG